MTTTTNLTAGMNVTVNVNGKWKKGIISKVYVDQANVRIGTNKLAQRFNIEDIRVDGATEPAETTNSNNTPAARWERMSHGERTDVLDKTTWSASLNWDKNWNDMPNGLRFAITAVLETNDYGMDRIAEGSWRPIAAPGDKFNQPII
jgi:hypothetical protein